MPNSLTLKKKCSAPPIRTIWKRWNQQSLPSQNGNLFALSLTRIVNWACWLIWRVALALPSSSITLSSLWHTLKQHFTAVYCTHHVFCMVNCMFDILHLPNDSATIANIMVSIAWTNYFANQSRDKVNSPVKQNELYFEWAFAMNAQKPHVVLVIHAR